MDKNIDSRVTNLEKELKALAETLHVYSRNTKEKITERFTEVSSQISNQAASNAEMKVALDNINTQLATLLMGGKTSEGIKDREPLCEGEEKEVGGGKDVKKDEEENHDEKDEYQSAEEEEPDPPKSPKSVLKPSGKALPSSKISAYRFGSSLLGAVPTDNIEGFLKEGFARLSGAFPDLSDSDIVEVVASNLDADVRDSIRANQIHDKKNFIRHVVAIISQNSSDPDETQQRFYSYSPKNKKLRQVVAELSQLSHNLNMEENERRKCLNNRIIAIMPKTAHKLALKHHWCQIGADADALELLHGVFSDRSLLEEIEKEWQVKSTARVQQTQSYNESERMNKLEKKGSKGPKRKERCKRCGLLKHATSQCTLYLEDSELFCNICYELTGYQNYHKEHQCRNAPWISVNNGSGNQKN